MAREKTMTQEEVQAQLPPIDTRAVFNQSLQEQGYYSFRLDRDPQILDAMKRMVDKELLKKLLAIGGSSGTHRIVFPTAEMVDQLLDIWANNKYEYFVLFNYSLYLSKDIEIAFDNKETALKSNLDAVARKYPETAAMIQQVPIEYFMKNELNYLGSITKYFPFYKEGMKTTALFAKLYPNKNFIDDLSTALTMRGECGKIRVSIDPCDFLTASLNNNGWSSCFSISTGFEHGGTMAWMLDKISMIAYLTKDDQSQFNVRSLNFTFNNKMWRQMYALDLKTMSFRSSTQYPRYTDDLVKDAKEMIMGTITAKIGEHPPWTVGAYDRTSYTRPAHDYHYNEVRNHSGFQMYIKTAASPNIVYETYPHLHCIYCGNTQGQNGLFACRTCQQQHERG